MYVVAIKDAKAWHGTSPFELSMIGFWNLMIVWLKVSPKLLSVRIATNFTAAPSTMEIFPALGTRRWY